MQNNLLQFLEAGSPAGLVHDAVPVLGVEQTEAQTLPLVAFRANRITADGHLLRCVRQSTGRKGNFSACPPGLEAEIKAFVVDTGNLYPLSIEAILCTEHLWFSLQFCIKWVFHHSVNAKKDNTIN